MGVNGCQETPRSKELDGEELQEVLGGELRSEAEGIRRSLDIVD